MFDQKRIFKKRREDVDQDVITEKLFIILYDQLVDLITFRYDLFTHRRVALAIMLAQEYDFDDIEPLLASKTEMQRIYDYLCRLDKVQSYVELSNGDYDQAIFYNEWHENSRTITDHIRDEAQPKDILKKLIALYTWLSTSSGIKHTVFLEESTLFAEDYEDEL